MGNDTQKGRSGAEFLTLLPTGWKYAVYDVLSSDEEIKRGMSILRVATEAQKVVFKLLKKVICRLEPPKPLNAFTTGSLARIEKMPNHAPEQTITKRVPEPESKKIIKASNERTKISS